MILVRLPVVFEPVDQHLERDEVLVVEVEAFWPHLDELLVDLLLWHVAKHDVLRVLRKDGEPVRNPLRGFLLLLFQPLLHVLEIVSI